MVARVFRSAKLHACSCETHLHCNNTNLIITTATDLQDMISYRDSLFICDRHFQFFRGTHPATGSLHRSNTENANLMLLYIHNILFSHAEQS